MDGELTAAQAIAVKIAFRRVTAINLKLPEDTVEQAVRIPGTVGWDRKAAAHSDIFNALADVTGDPVVAPVLISGVGLSYDLMVAAGRAAGRDDNRFPATYAGAASGRGRRGSAGGHGQSSPRADCLWRMAREQRASRSQP